LAVGYVDVGHGLRPFLGTKKSASPRRVRREREVTMNARIKTVIATIAAAAAALAWWKKTRETDDTEEQEDTANIDDDE
jgi:hypothetical protein